MKNHWLKKKENKITIEDVRLARELEAEGVESVCEYNEMADVEPTASIEVKAPTLPGDVTLVCSGGGSWTMDIPDVFSDAPPITITETAVDFCGKPLCISGTPSPFPDPAISSITISNDWSSFEPGQTALAELDMEIGNGSIKYTRETTIGIFTFKDAGELGVDIFQNGIKVGWLNNQGEKALKQWLNDKPTTVATTTHMGSTYTIGIDPAISHLNDTYFFKKEVYPDYNKKAYDRNYDPYNIKEVSNEIINVFYAGQYNVYQLKNKNIVPGSVLLTVFVNDVATQSENLTGHGILTDKNYLGERTAMSGAKIDHNTGIITVNWINFQSTEYRHLSVCYEYKDYEVKGNKVC